MTTYARSRPGSPEVVDRWETGLTWMAHPEEDGRRASHTVRGDDGVWLLDPIDAPGIDDVIAELGDVVGVAVLSNYHVRDAGRVARRHGVPVWVPTWMDRIDDRIDAEVVRYEANLGESGYRVHRHSPLPGWTEGIAYRPADGTLVIPDSMGTVEASRVGPERLGCHLVIRLVAPDDPFRGFDPERILVGHGSGIFEDAPEALETAIDGSRRRFPRALVDGGWKQIRAMIDALR